MDINNKPIWQVAAGDTDRDYAEICLRWDAIMVGPGDEGPWPDCRAALKSWPVTSRKLTDIGLFCTEVADGDLVILRIGTCLVYGIGIVVGRYEWNPHFGDIDGWNLQHVRRVKWIWKASGKPREFPTYTMKLGNTTQRLDSPAINEWIKSLNIPQSTLDRKLVSLPPRMPEKEINSEVGVEDIAEYLFDAGVANSSVEHLTDQIGELRRIARWYGKGNQPSEAETKAYLVIPLLRALGWTPQRMALEWNSLDIALFNNLPRKDANLAALVEAKTIEKSCLTARSQAENYAVQKGRKGCKRLIVTNGIRYGVFLKDKSNAFAAHPAAYLNLAWMKGAYPILGPNCKGTKEALQIMSSDWSE